MMQASFEYNNFWLVWKSYVPSYSKHPWDKLSKADILEALIWVFLGMFFGITIPKYLPVILKTIQGLSSTKVAFRGPPILIRKSYNHWQIYTWIARNAPDHQISYSLILGKCTLNPVQIWKHFDTTGLTLNIFLTFISKLSSGVYMRYMVINPVVLYIHVYML